MDYKKLGLMVGLEIHQELATKHKLFCKCPPELFKDDPEYTFIRKLRPSQSELGEVDPAALFEFLKGKTIMYEANRSTSCLVEMDEEPPGPLNPEAIDICLLFTVLTGGVPLDEIHVMRKIVVDGSNTTGFQRTSVISLGGKLDVKGKTIKLQQVSLEEDAARKTGEKDGMTVYRLDRLGIPLIEIATAPDIRSPEEAEETALVIGKILRATGKVMRGLGSIRQDVNVSIRDGALIEIKGVQQLDLVNKTVEYEVQRQVGLIGIIEELKKRGIVTKDIVNKTLDVSHLFKDSESRIIKNAFKNKGKVLALKLEGFAGLVGYELTPNRRLGTEMSDHAKFKGGVRGIFHTDELPAYNITQDEVDKLRDYMEAQATDAVVIVADNEEKCRKALEAVVDRARQAITGIPEETRSANPDGTTHFTRPRPGAARMYPETDVVPTEITTERLEYIQNNLPEMPEEKLKRFKKEYRLNEKLANQIINSDYIELFETAAREDKTDTTLLAVTLTEDFKSIERDGIPINKIRDKTIRDTFKLVIDGTTAKESLLDIFTLLAETPDMNPKEAIEALGLGMIPEEDLKALINATVNEKSDMITSMGARAFGPLMGLIMKEVRGKAEANHIQKLLQEAIKNHG